MLSSTLPEGTSSTRPELSLTRALAAGPYFQLMIDANAQLRAQRGVYGLMSIANAQANAQVSDRDYIYKFATFTSKYLGSNLSFCSEI